MTYFQKIKNQAAALAVGLVMAMGLTAPAGAVNLTELQVAKLDGRKVAARVASNESDFVRLTYVGSSTEAVVTITTTVITAYAPAGTADTNFGVSAGSYTLFSTAYDTMGELCDAIDALSDYECELLGAKRDDNPTKMKDQTATSGTCDLKAVGGCVVDIHAGAANTANDSAYDIRVGITPKTGRRVRLRTCTGNVNGSTTVKVYGKLAKYEGVSDGVTRNDTTEVWRIAVTDDTDATLPASVPNDEGFLEFARDAHVVISGGNSTNVQAAANFVECQWEER